MRASVSSARIRYRKCVKRWRLCPVSYTHLDVYKRQVFIFKDMAKKALNEIYEAGKIPIIVGGTGFYIQALLYDIDFTEQDVDVYKRQILRLSPSFLLQSLRLSHMQLRCFY